jgi:ribosomal-protein-alanine N-acetyltransferase
LTNIDAMALPVVLTERMLLRPWTREDVDALHALWTAPEVRRFLWDDMVIPREAAEQVVAAHLVTAEQYSFGYWSLHIPPAREQLAGFCGFRFLEDSRDIELMYGLRGDYWARGYATEACIAALDYLWRATRFKRVFARTDPPNRRSIAVMLRLGMQHVATTENTITYMLLRPSS